MIEKMKSNLLAGIATIIPLALTVYVIQVTLEITIWLGGTVAEPLERFVNVTFCLLYTSPSPRDRTRSRMPSSA